MGEEKKPIDKTRSGTIPAVPKTYKPGDTYEVPAEGSLGLLALGYKGLEAWRKAQQNAPQATIENTNTANEAVE